MTTAMVHSEALAWKEKVGETAVNLRTLLWEGYQREVWLALGHESWNQCLMEIAKGYDLTWQRLWQLHYANEVEARLNRGLTVGGVRERVLRPIAKLPEPLQVEAWERSKREAEETGKPLNYKMTTMIAKALTPLKVTVVEKEVEGEEEIIESDDPLDRVDAMLREVAVVLSEFDDEERMKELTAQYSSERKEQFRQRLELLSRRIADVSDRIPGRKINGKSVLTLVNGGGD